MNFLLQWHQAYMLYWLIPFLVGIIWYRLYYYRSIEYAYSLVHVLLLDIQQSGTLHQKILFCMRSLLLAVIALLVAMPRLVDVDSRIPVEGIDIMLVLDVSGSMQQKDDEKDNRTRLDVAKQEAIRFIEKRDNDAIGLVLFANDALSRAPLTMDKTLLKEVVHDVEIGLIQPNGTLLFTGIITAANRLKHSHAKSKIMILLTDGEPTEGDTHAQTAMEIVRQLGIKVYTIGIGSDEPRYIQHPFGLIPIPGVNKELLHEIAYHSGGQSFLAKNPGDMRRIYDQINTLETSQQEVPLFGRWYDLAFSLIWVILLLVLSELMLETYIWFSI